MTKDWKGERYIGMNFCWDYKGGKVQFVLPGHVVRALSEFHHKAPRKRQDDPYDMSQKKHGVASQEVDEPVASSPVRKANQKFTQKIPRKKYVPWT